MSLPTSVRFWLSRLAKGFLILILIVGCFLVFKADQAREDDPSEVRVLSDASDHPSSLQIVALGDSYMSGEGTGRYLSGTDHGHWSNACRQSKLAYPVLLATSLAETPVRKGDAYTDVHLEFAACSGAVAGNIGTEFTDDRVRPVKQFRSIPKQIELLKQHPEADVVLLSVGGNDAGFSQAVLTCAGPDPAHGCEERAEKWLGGVTTPIDEKGPVPSLALKLRDVMHQIRTVAANARYYVTTYPRPTSELSCPLMGLTESEVKFINERYLHALNEDIRYAAWAEGFQVIDLEDAWAGRGLCAGPGSTGDAINAWRWQWPDWWLDNPKRFLNGSVHPTAAGHELFNSVVEPIVRAGIGQPAPNVEPGDPAVLCESRRPAVQDPGQGPPPAPGSSETDQCENPPPFPTGPDFGDDFSADGTWCSTAAPAWLWPCQIPERGDPTPTPPDQTLPPSELPPLAPDVAGSRCTRHQTPYYYVFETRAKGDLAVQGARPGSIACFRGYSEGWHSATVGSTGTVRVEVGADVSGLAGRRQVIYQSDRDGHLIARTEWPRPAAPPSELDFLDTWLGTNSPGRVGLSVLRFVQSLPTILSTLVALALLSVLCLLLERLAALVRWGAQRVVSWVA